MRTDPSQLQESMRSKIARAVFSDTYANMYMVRLVRLSLWATRYAPLIADRLVLIALVAAAVAIMAYPGLLIILLRCFCGPSRSMYGSWHHHCGIRFWVDFGLDHIDPSAHPLPGSSCPYYPICPVCQVCQQWPEFINSSPNNFIMVVNPVPKDCRMCQRFPSTCLILRQVL